MKSRTPKIDDVEKAVKRNLETITLRPTLNRPSKEALPPDELPVTPSNDPAFKKQIMGFREWCEKVWDCREVLIDEAPAAK